MNVRIMYDPAPIRHIAVQCPDCERWFNGRDIDDKELAVWRLTSTLCGLPSMTIKEAINHIKNL